MRTLAVRSTRRRRFDPRAVPGCVGWFDATVVGSVIADGSDVSRWMDLSGFGCHLDTPAITNLPSLKLDIRNGLNVVRFAAATNRGIYTSAAPLATLVNGEDIPSSIFTVARVSDAAANYTLAGWARSSSDTPFKRQLFASAGAFRWGPRDDANASVNPQVTITPDTDFHVWSSMDNGTACDIVYDGGSAALAQGSNVGTMTIDRFGLGVLPRLNPTAILNGDIGECIIYNRFIAARERKTIEQYLATKWGVLLTG